MSLVESLTRQHEEMRSHLDVMEAYLRASTWEVAQALEVHARLKAILGVLRNLHGPQERDLFGALPDAAFEENPGLLALLAESEWLEAELAGLVDDSGSPVAMEWDELNRRLGPFIFGLRQLMRMEETLLFPNTAATDSARMGLARQTR